jgi:uncharacterized membrane protein YcaP (DUF421 family)
MESVLRGAAVYLFLVLLFRIAGKRTLAHITTFDFVLLLIIGESTQQALLGDDFSVTNAFLVVVTLTVMSMGFDLLKHSSPAIDRILEDLPLVVVKDGKPLRKRMDMANLDLEDILEAARQSQGIGRLSEIGYAVLERNGDISIIPSESGSKKEAS